MGNLRKKKFRAGEGNQYWPRSMALKKLQLSLKDFRRLCILKGIYPREPRNRKKAQRGSTGIRTLYNKKDIQFLMHEPIIWKFREMKTQGRKIGRAKSMREKGLAKKLMRQPIHIKLDHIVKERYPTFMDALRDLDDCLTLIHLFSTFPKLKRIPPDHTALCRRLILEFMLAVIQARALRKVFISIKGYYFQVEFKGQLITWIMPHQFGFEPQPKEEVDFRIMATFVQFYIVLLGFVNFRLYHQMNLHYPPRVRPIPEGEDANLIDKEALQSERIAALNYSLVVTSKETVTEEDVQLDTFQMETDEENAVEKAFAEAEKIRKLKTLFQGMKVFLNREVPREPLVFVLRCFGAEVSWDKTLFVGSSFDETDETITHQIVDRSDLNKQYISRYYVQPQWVFDSVNARELLPVEKYFPGVVLPPHLSPFVDASKVEIYHPPEEEDLFQPKVTTEQSQLSEEKENEDEEEPNVEEEDKETKKLRLKKKMKAERGKPDVEDPVEMKAKEKEDYKLREKMVERKHQKLYRSMIKGRALRARDAKVLKKKREAIETRKGLTESSG